MPTHASFKFPLLGEHLSNASLIEIIDNGTTFKLVTMGDSLSLASTAHHDLQKTAGEILDDNNPLTRRWVPIFRWMVKNNRRTPLCLVGPSATSPTSDEIFETILLPLGTAERLTHFVLTALFPFAGK